MGFTLVPWIITGLLIGVPVLFIPFRRRVAIWAGSGSATILLALFLWVYVPGWLLMQKADRGDPVAMYELARWTENHDEHIGMFIPWPVVPDVLGGYACLERSAALNYPPAIYAIGVRLKYGEHVPRPDDWTGADGNYFPQPNRGQVYIDRAIHLGFRPTGDEKTFYWKQYRVRYLFG